MTPNEVHPGDWNPSSDRKMIQNSQSDSTQKHSEEKKDSTFKPTFPRPVDPKVPDPQAGMSDRNTNSADKKNPN